MKSKLPSLSLFENTDKREIGCRSLLIVGAGTYAQVAFEIAEQMGVYERISFVDDCRKETANGKTVIGTTSDLKDLASKYSDAIVAIGNAEVRFSMLQKIEGETSLKLATLISPQAFVSPTAHILPGCIIEPMAVIHTGCKIKRGCYISAGAVVNHESICEEVVHIDCNATVEGYCTVLKKTKVCAGEVYRKKA